MDDYMAEGWFIPNGKKLTSEDLAFVKTHLLRHGDLVTDTLYWKDKNDRVRVLKAGEPFDRQGRIVAVLRESPDMLQVVCEHALESSNMVAQTELISRENYQFRRVVGGKV